jgi:hypothetical protein
MIGQVVLCPGCLERVYVTDGSKKSPESKEQASDLGAASLFAADTLAKVRQAPQARSFSLPVGLIAGVCALAVLTVTAVILLTQSWSGTGTQQAADASAVGEEDDSNAAVDQSMAKLRAASGMNHTVASNSPAPTAAAPAKKLPPPTAESATAAAPVAMTIAPTTPAESPGTAKADVQRSLPETRTAGAVPPALNGSAWPEVWRLPDAASNSAQPLTSLADAETAIRVGVRSPVATMRMGLNSAVSRGILLQPEPPKNPTAWTVSYPSSQGGGGHEALATVRREGHDLLFAWSANQTSTEGRQELANSLVEVSSGTARRYGQLRQPFRADPILLDLSAVNQTVELQIADSPRPDSLRLEISELTGFSSEAQVRGGLKTAAMPAPSGAQPRIVQPQLAPQGRPQGLSPIGMQSLAQQQMGMQTIVIEFADIPGFELRIRFIRAEQIGELAFSIEQIYREGPKEFDLRSARQLDNLESEHQVTSAKAQRALPTAEAKLNRALSEEKKHKGIEPLANDKKRFNGWQTKQRQIADAIAKGESEVKFLKETIDVHQSRTDAVTKIRQFIKDSDKKAAISYVVYLECGQPDILVVDGRGAQ